MNSDADKKAFVERMKVVVGDESLRSFAARTGLSPTAISQYLSGKSEPTRPSLTAIAKAVGVSVEWLATGRDPANAGSTLPVPERPDDLDEKLVGWLVDEVLATYKDMGQVIAPIHLGRLVARIHNEIASASDGPEDWPGAVKLRMAQLRRELKAAADDPASSKRRA